MLRICEGGSSKGTHCSSIVDGCVSSELGLPCPNRDSGYYNPMLAYGEEKAIQDAYEAGANGFIMVDLPPEEAALFREKCTKAQ